VLLLFASLARSFDSSSFTTHFANQATLATDTEYELVLTWNHDYSKAPSVGWALAKNAKSKGGACDPDAGMMAPDGQPYWMPRFFPTAVPSQVTEVTGIKYVSPDWQPCGHKDIVICHGESHYDFHLYYQSQQDIETKAACDGNPNKPSHYIICDDNTPRNNEMFKLMQHDIPTRRTSTTKSPMPDYSVGTGKDLSYCVDPTSGVPKSGIHYGDLSETLTEWKEPVTIMGSHSCALTFFEPMISWKWITAQVNNIKGWPSWNSGEITYNQQTFEALPTSWKVDVGADCAGGDSSKVCQISLTVRGKKCPAGGCAAPVKNCGTQTDCLTDQPYQSSYGSSTSCDKAAYAANASQCATQLGGATHCFTDDGQTIILGNGCTPDTSTPSTTPTTVLSTIEQAITDGTMSASKWILGDTQNAYKKAFLYMYAPECFTGTTQNPGCLVTAALAGSQITFKAGLSTAIKSASELSKYVERRARKTDAEFRDALNAIVTSHSYAVPVPETSSFTMGGAKVSIASATSSSSATCFVQPLLLMVGAWATMWFTWS